MPKISVVIPTYNAIDYLPEAIGSVLNQSFADFELIIVDDGSTDNTAQWVSQLQDDRINLIYQVHQGKSVARNAGVKAAKADYIAFLDADDIWEAAKLEQQFNYLQANPNIGVVYTWTAIADQDGIPTGHLVASTLEGDVWEELIKKNILACGSTPMIRASCFETVGLFNRHLPYAQDWDMWLRLAAKYRFGVIPLPCVRYRRHAENSSKNWRKMEIFSSQVIEQALAKLPKRHKAAEASIRATAYNNLYLYLGWINFNAKDYNNAYALLRKAHRLAPKKIFTTESLRLLTAISLTRCLGEKTYKVLLNFRLQIRRCLIFRDTQRRSNIKDFASGGELLNVSS